MSCNVFVITVVLNDLEGIKKTAQSLLNQSDHDFRWIVQDGCSTDGTMEYLSLSSINFLELHSEKDDGIYHAMNKAFKRVINRSTHICFLNAGDEFLSNAIETFKSQIDYRTNKIVFSGWNMIMENGSMFSLFPNLKTLTYKMSVCHEACLIPTELLERYEGYDTAFKYASDFNFFLRAKLDGIEMYCVNKVLVNYYRGGASDVHFLDARMEIIRSLIKNRSSDLVLGTFYYVRQIINYYILKYKS